MKTILVACLTAIVLSFIAGVVLNSVQVPADQGFAESASVRL